MLHDCLCMWLSGALCSSRAVHLPSTYSIAQLLTYTLLGSCFAPHCMHVYLIFVTFMNHMWVVLKITPLSKCRNWTPFSPHSQNFIFSFYPATIHVSWELWNWGHVFLHCNYYWILTILHHHLLRSLALKYVFPKSGCSCLHLHSITFTHAFSCPFF